MEQKIQVKKRDGSLENFDEKKVARVVKAAGLSQDQAGKLADEVAGWVNNLEQSPISSLQIRDKVLEELRKVNQYAANLYQWYEKTKETS